MLANIFNKRDYTFYDIDSPKTFKNTPLRADNLYSIQLSLDNMRATHGREVYTFL